MLVAISFVEEPHGSEAIQDNQAIQDCHWPASSDCESARGIDPLEARIRALQRRIGVKPDGVIGPLTLTRLEELLGPAPVAPVEPVPSPTEVASLTVSTKGVDMLVTFEVSARRPPTRRSTSTRSGPAARAA